VVFGALFFLTLAGVAHGKTGWKREEVDLRLPNNSKVRAIRYPEGKRPLTRAKMESKPRRRKAKETRDADGIISTVEEVAVSVIESPPLDGFVPWVVVTLTDERSGDFDYSDYPETSVVGDFLASDPNKDYAIGLFDTGASIHLASYGARQRMNITNDLLTPNPVIITGVTGEVETLVSYPMGVFATGADALEATSETDPNAVIVDMSGMVGHTNVSIAVGQIPEPNLPDIPTVIGTPFSVNFSTVINTGQEITITYGGQTYSTPDIEFYEEGDPSIPYYTSYVPLRLVPEGGIDVEYYPDVLAIIDWIYRPFYPSMIGTLLQSRFFVNAVHLYEGSYDSEDKAKFLLDTGAQITVIGDYVAANLRLDLADAEFWVEIEGVTGEVVEKPGFYIDAVDIEGVGDWLEFTNVPVVHLENEFIPGGDGTALDGIIGMNLLTEYNLVLRGNYSAPELRFEYTGQGNIAADIAPEGGDGAVNDLDLLKLADCWLGSFPPASANWDEDCDIAPEGQPDNKIDMLDFALMAEHWMEGV
jgi:hypothetical protein